MIISAFSEILCKGVRDLKASSERFYKHLRKHDNVTDPPQDNILIFLT